MIVWLLVMLAAIVGSAWVFGAWGWLWYRVKQLEQGQPGAGQDPQLLSELDVLREEVASTQEEARLLEERVDFLEKLLETRDASEPGRLKLTGDQEEGGD